MSIPGAEKKVVAGILAILLGGFGAHRFYLGDTTGGIIRIVMCFGLWGLIGVIEGIIMLTKTDQQFVDEYIVGKKAWF